MILPSLALPWAQLVHPSATLECEHRRRPVMAAMACGLQPHPGGARHAAPCSALPQRRSPLLVAAGAPGAAAPVGASTRPTPRQRGPPRVNATQSQRDRLRVNTDGALTQPSSVNLAREALDVRLHHLSRGRNDRFTLCAPRVQLHVVHGG